MDKHEMWDKLHKIYEGDDKVQKEKLQTHRGKFETLKINEEDSIAIYFLRLDDIANTIKGLGEEIEENVIVKKNFRSLPSRFNPEIFVIEELGDLENLTMEDFHIILTTYEMRIKHDNPTKLSRHQIRQRKKSKNQVI
jgi:hypothetical protein